MKKQLFKLSAIALLLGLSQGASATTYNLGAFGAGSEGQHYLQPAEFFAANSIVDDTFSFTLTKSFSLQNFVWRSEGGFSSDFKATFITPNGSYNYTADPDDALSLLTPGTLLTSGNYGIHVTGTAEDLAASYNGFIDIQAAVPEAEEWAMMTIGLGLISVVARRKKSVTSVA